MAKSLDKDGAEKPENTGENAPASSTLVMQALGPLADYLEIKQAEGEEEIHFAVRCIEQLGAQVRVSRMELQMLREDLKAANRRLASQRGATTKAKAKIVEMEEAGKPRALGPMAAVFDDPAEAFTVDDLLTAIDGAEEIVLAFSDGTSELKGIKPRKVSAEAFRFTRGRLHFIEGPLEVTGPGGEDTVTTLAGVALLVDGEQVAWSPMSQAVRIGAGQTMNLAGSVIFG